MLYSTNFTTMGRLSVNNIAVADSVTTVGLPHIVYFTAECVVEHCHYTVASTSYLHPHRHHQY